MKKKGLLLMIAIYVIAIFLTGCKEKISTPVVTISPTEEKTIRLSTQMTTKNENNDSNIHLTFENASFSSGNLNININAENKKNEDITLCFAGCKLNGETMIYGQNDGSEEKIGFGFVKENIIKKNSKEEIKYVLYRMERIKSIDEVKSLQLYFSIKDAEAEKIIDDSVEINVINKENINPPIDGMEKCFEDEEITLYVNTTPTKDSMARDEFRYLIVNKTNQLISIGPTLAKYKTSANGFEYEDNFYDFYTQVWPNSYAKGIFSIKGSMSLDVYRIEFAMKGTRRGINYALTLDGKNEHKLKSQDKVITITRKH